MHPAPSRRPRQRTLPSRRDAMKVGAATLAAVWAGGKWQSMRAAEATGDAPRKISRGAAQIFVDLDDVDPLDNVKQLFHSAGKLADNPVLAAQTPWDREGGAPCASMIFDVDEKVFKCWYQGVLGDKYGTTEYGPHTLNYAVSTDGIRWERPDLGLHEVEGSKHNNVVVPPQYHKGKDHWESVLKDPLDPDPERRYKAIGWSSDMGGLYSMTSPDGLTWTHSPNVVLPGGDAQSLMIDVMKHRYVAFMRSPGNRWYSVSDDFAHWSPQADSLAPPPGQPGGPTLYNHIGFNYGDQYLGLVSYFHMLEDDPRFPQLDVRLLSSRDSLVYRFPGETPRDREPLIACGTYGDWDRWMAMLTGAPPIRVGDKLYIYYRGFSRRHKPYGPPKFKDSYEAGALGLAMIRVDGFASLAAGFDGGRVTTKPFVFQGDSLLLNAKADAHARIIVEVLDVQGNSISGYGVDDCLPITVDSVAYKVVWQQKPGLGELAGRPIALRFHLTNARLYSYNVV